MAGGAAFLLLAHTLAGRAPTIGNLLAATAGRTRLSRPPHPSATWAYCVIPLGKLHDLLLPDLRKEPDRLSISGYREKPTKV